MPGFDHIETAQKVRDLIRSQALQTVSQQAPRPNFGRVISVDFVSKTATVWFPGDDKPVSVNLFSSTFPGQWHEKFSVGSGSGIESTSRTGYGSIVAVENFNGKLYITEVLNGGQFAVDQQSAGEIPMQHGVDGLPFNPAGGDYSYFVLWNTFGNNKQAALPRNGGPFAINIGPFIYWNTGPPPSSEHEVQISGWLGESQSFKFSLNSYFQMAKNNFGSVYDRWFRVIASHLNEDDVSANSNRVVNNTSTFSVNLGDWTAGTNTTIVRSTARTNSGIASMKINSTTGTQLVLEAKTDITKKYQVLPYTVYNAQFDVFSTSAWASGVATSVDWYDSSGASLGSTTSPATPVVANTWTTLPLYAHNGGSGAAFGVFKIKVLGTPSAAQDFFVDNVKFIAVSSVTKTEVSLDVALRKTQHGATDSELSNSHGELWIRVYIHWINAVDNPNWTVRYKNVGGWAQAKSTQTGKIVYEYITNPTDAVGYLGYHDSNALFTTNTTQIQTPPYRGTWSTGPWRNPDLITAQRAQIVLNGGGLVTWDGTNIKWTHPFQVSSIGKSRHGISEWYVEVTMPTSGTIRALPDDVASVTATANGIPLLTGQSLWVAIPPGTGPNMTSPVYFNGGLHGTGGLFIVDSSSDEYWNVPEWAVLIASRMVVAGANAPGPDIRLGNGVLLDNWHAITWLNGWANFGSGNVNGQYRFISESNSIHVIGVLTAGTSSGMFTFPSAYWPKHRIRSAAIYAQSGSNWIDLNTNGSLVVVNPFTAGNVFELNCIYPLDA
jgi:hypothetical protein